MTLRFRRGLYTLAIAAFLIAAPLLIAYTSGYRYDASKNRFILTGSIFVRTQPEDVEIFLNNTRVGTASPLRLNHLLPNRYTLEVMKDGYHTWHKELEVNQKEATFAENIILWPTSPTSSHIATGTISEITIDAQSTRLIWQSENVIHGHNLLNNNTQDILELDTSEPTTFTWASDDVHVLVNQNSKYWLVNKNDFSVRALHAIRGLANSELKLHPTLADVILYKTTTGVESYNLTTLTRQSVITEPVIDFAWHNNAWYYLRATEPVSLVIKSQTTPDLSNVAYQLPSAPSYKLIKIIANQAFVYQPETQTLYRFTLDPENFNTTSQIIKPVTDWQFNTRNTRLLLSNNWEVWSIDLTTNESRIITRLSEPITAAQWYADENYILIELTDRVEMIELDNRDHRNHAALKQADVLHDALLDPNGEYLYVNSTDAEKTILERLDIFERPTTILP